MTAPITPTACNKAFASQSLHHGIIIPLNISPTSGCETVNWSSNQKLPKRMQEKYFLRFT